MRWIFVTAAVAIAGAALSTFDASPTQAAVLSVGPASTGAPYGGYECMDVRANSLTLTTPVQVFDCHAGTNQEFEFYGSTIYAESGQRCLDVLGAGTANGTTVDS